MTCEEFAAAIKTDPFKATTALRAATFVHSSECDSCRAALDQAADRVDKIAPLTIVEHLAAISLVDSDLSDNECRQMVSEAKKKRAERMAGGQ